MINSNKNYSIEKLRWRWHITIILRRTHMQMTLTTQIYGFCRPHEVDRLADRVSVCIDETSAWMKSNRLQLSPTKTEVLWCSSSRRQHQIPTGPIQVGNTSVLPVSQVRDLGVYLDADVTMRAHVTATVRKCFLALRQIRSVRCSMPRHAFLTLIWSLVVSSIVYCNPVLVWPPSRPAAVST